MASRNDPLYNVWNGMKVRCYLTFNPNYSTWGGKGITVCDAWLNSFEQFKKDMGPRPGAFEKVFRLNIS